MIDNKWRQRHFSLDDNISVFAFNLNSILLLSFMSAFGGAKILFYLNIFFLISHFFVSLSFLCVRLIYSANVVTLHKIETTECNNSKTATAVHAIYRVSGEAVGRRKKKFGVNTDWALNECTTGECGVWVACVREWIYVHRKRYPFRRKPSGKRERERKRMERHGSSRIRSKMLVKWKEERRANSDEHPWHRCMFGHVLTHATQAQLIHLLPFSMCIVFREYMSRCTFTTTTSYRIR